MAEPLVPCPRCAANISKGCLLCAEPDDTPWSDRPSATHRDPNAPVPAGLALQYELLRGKIADDRHEVASLRRAYFYEHGPLP